MLQAQFIHPELNAGPQHPEAVHYTATEVDGGSLREVLGGTGYLPDPVAEPNDLGEHLVVEDEVVRVLGQRELLQRAAGRRGAGASLHRRLEVAGAGLCA